MSAMLACVASVLDFSSAGFFSSGLAFKAASSLSYSTLIISATS